MFLDFSVYEKLSKINVRGLTLSADIGIGTGRDGLVAGGYGVTRTLSHCTHVSQIGVDDFFFRSSSRVF